MARHVICPRMLHLLSTRNEESLDMATECVQQFMLTYNEMLYRHGDARALNMTILAECDYFGQNWAYYIQNANPMEIFREEQVFVEIVNQVAQELGRQFEARSTPKLKYHRYAECEPSDRRWVSSLINQRVVV